MAEMTASPSPTAETRPSCTVATFSLELVQKRLFSEAFGGEMVAVSFTGALPIRMESGFGDSVMEVTRTAPSFTVTVQDVL